MQIAEFPAVGCDSCLEWIHIPCANKKKIQRTASATVRLVNYKLQYVHVELGLLTEILPK